MTDELLDKAVRAFCNAPPSNEPIHAGMRAALAVVIPEVLEREAGVADVHMSPTPDTAATWWFGDGRFRAATEIAADIRALLPGGAAPTRPVPDRYISEAEMAAIERVDWQASKAQVAALVAEVRNAWGATTKGGGR